MALFNNPKGVQYAIAAFIVILCLSFAVKCRADETHYVQVSGGSTVVRGQAPALDIEFNVPASVAKGASWQSGFTIVGSSTFYGVDQPNNAYYYGRIVDGFGHFDVGLGVCALHHTDAYNGATVNFNLMAAYRLPFGATITYEHCSDAGMTRVNLGRDILLLGWRFR